MTAQRPHRCAFARERAGDARRRRLTAAAICALASIAAPAPARCAGLFGLLDTGEIYHSTDGGAGWSARGTLPVRDAVALVARATASDLYLATRSGVVYGSSDGGDSWRAVGALPASDVVDLAVRPSGALLVLTRTGVLSVSTDLGLRFDALAALPASDFTSLVFAAPTHYALTRSGEVYASSDGVAWIAVGAIATAGARQLRALQPHLYVLNETGDIYRSADAGAHWTAVGTLSQVGMRGLVRDGTRLVAVSREGHVARSGDGVAWEWHGSINQVAVTALASDEALASDATVLAPMQWFVGAPYPNPTAGAVALALRLDHAATLQLALYDVGGRMRTRLPARAYAAGTHVIAWDGRGLAAGHYFLQLEDGRGNRVSRRVVVRR
jgi:photosystem II stability/assembly factor-like uncharacterized protein